MDGEKNSYKTGPLGYLARCIFLSNWRASIPYSVTPQKMSHLAYMHFAACLADAEQGHSSLLWKWHTKQNDSGTCFCTICTILMVLGRKVVFQSLYSCEHRIIYILAWTTCLKGYYLSKPGPFMYWYVWCVNDSYLKLQNWSRRYPQVAATCLQDNPVGQLWLSKLHPL